MQVKTLARKQWKRYGKRADADLVQERRPRMLAGSGFERDAGRCRAHRVAQSRVPNLGQTSTSSTQYSQFELPLAWKKP